MSISYDASSEGANTGLSVTFTHTPVGTPSGIFVFCAENSLSGDDIASASYGLTDMTRINRAVDSSGEVGQLVGFFLGSGIPTGAQTVIVAGTNSNSKWAVCISVTAVGNTQLAGTGSGIVEGDVANPSVTITGIAGASYGAAGLFSGDNAPSNITAGPGQTIRQDNDFGSQSASSESSTSQQASGNQVIAFTVGSDDVAMVAIAIEQTVPDSAVKTINGVAKASVKTFDNVAIANVKTINGV